MYCNFQTRDAKVGLKTLFTEPWAIIRNTLIAKTFLTVCFELKTKFLKFLYWIYENIRFNNYNAYSHEFQVNCYDLLAYRCQKIVYYVETLMFRSRHSSDWPEAVLVGVALGRSPCPQVVGGGGGSGVLTAGRHVDIEAQTVLALVGQEWDQSAQLQVAVLGHEPQRGRHIADVGVALRTDGRQRIG